MVTSFVPFNVPIANGVVYVFEPVKAALTVMLAEVERMLVIPAGFCNAPAGMVFVSVPDAVMPAFTVAVIVQVPGARKGMVPFVRVIVSLAIVVVPMTTVSIPLVQVVTGVPVKVKPPGKVSEMLTPV